MTTVTLAHPLAALIGLPDSALGAKPAAFVTVDQAQALTGDALKAAIQGKVAYDLAPLSVSVVEALPMTPTGKISKAELAAGLTRSA